MALTIATIVCAYDEVQLLPACLHSLLAQTRPPNEIIAVDNASTDGTGAVARLILGVRVVDEPEKGLVIAREAGRRVAQADILAYVDADCRVPPFWLERPSTCIRGRRCCDATSGETRSRGRFARTLTSR